MPILYHDLEADKRDFVQAEIREALPKILKMDLTNPWEDTVETSFKYSPRDCNILQDMCLYTLEEIIIDQARFFCSEYGLGYDLEVKESWINFSKKGGFQHSHNHLPYLLSGIYYYQTNGEDGSLQFTSPNPWLNDRTYPFGFDKVTYQPIVGRLIIFPSYLAHLVNINKTDSTRISVSFNIEVARVQNDS